jgi:hypothetical protein
LRDQVSAEFIMNGISRTLSLRSGTIAVLIASAFCVARAQQPASSDTRNASEMLRTIDRLVEQNRQLEEQNQELINQIMVMRKALAGELTSGQQTTPAAATPGMRTASSVVPAAEPSLGSVSATVAGALPPAAAPGSQQVQPSGSSSLSAAQTPPPGDTNVELGKLMWGEWVPGPGFRVARTEVGELNLSGYMVGRYLNALPPDQEATDHLGRPIPVQARQDFQFHRVMLYASGWMFDPRFKYMTFVWTVNDTTQDAIGGTLTYSFSDQFNLGVGWNALPVNRSLQGSHPYWPTYDRVMADEFFRPFFTQGIFGSGDIGRVNYKWMVGNNLSNLDVTGRQLTRELNFGGSLTWMPTTGEFGPRTAFGDYEDHQNLATLFGAAYVVSRENRQSNTGETTNNTTLRLADSLNVFDTGTFAPGVTVEKVTYRMTTASAGMKKRGFWLQGEGYYRLLDNFRADGSLPVGAVRDTGFYVQAAYMVVPKVAELYAGTSYVFSDYGRPKEFLFGSNWYPANSRNYRLNLHFINVDESPVSSLFGFYSGKITGQVLAVGVTALY